MTKKFKSWIIAIMLWALLILTPSFIFARGFWDMIWVSGVGVPWTNTTQGDSLIHTIQTAINWVLGMLSFVALVLCLYAGFQMLISWWDSKKYDAWFTILKNAAIWLAIIAVSWLIVSLIFRLINGSIWPNVSDDVDTNELYPTTNQPNVQLIDGPQHN
jgi:hypothetical protein